MKTETRPLVHITLHHDPDEIRERMESVLGSSLSLKLSASGFLEYTCPFCQSRHFGVCYDTNSRFSLGAWSCFRCGVSGVGFHSLCRSLCRDEPKIITRPLPTIKKPIESNPEDFQKIWNHISKTRVNLFNLTHKTMLESRGIEVEKLPGWFTIPNITELHKISAFFGLDAAENALLVSGKKPAYFTGRQRLAIVYPQCSWKDNSLFIATYEQGAGDYKLFRPRGISTQGILYNRAEPKGETLIITEGEIKAEASYQAGMPTLGMLGVSTGRDSIVKFLEYSEWKPKTVKLVFDRDVKESSIIPVEKAIQRVEQTLKDSLGRTCPKIERVHLPELVPGEKVDIDSFIGYYQKKIGLESARKEYRKLLKI